MKLLQSLLCATLFAGATSTAVAAPINPGTRNPDGTYSSSGQGAVSSATHQASNATGLLAHFGETNNEPGSLLLMGTGMFALAGMLSLRRRYRLRATL